MKIHVLLLLGTSLVSFVLAFILGAAALPATLCLTLLGFLAAVTGQAVNAIDYRMKREEMRREGER